MLRAFDQAEPIGDRRSDLLFALLQHTTAAVQVGSKKAPSVADFLPEFWAKEPANRGGSDGS